MSKLRFAPVALALAAGATHATCMPEATRSGVDAQLASLQAREADLARIELPGGADAGQGAWLHATVRDGLLDLIGQLQVLKMLLELHDSISGAANQRKVAAAVDAMAATAVDNARALRELVRYGETKAAAAHAEALAGAAAAISSVERLCAKKETPEAGR